MKKIIFSIALIIGMIASTYGQFSWDAEGVKMTSPEVYSAIRGSAVERYNNELDDRDGKIKAEINAQCEAFVAISKMRDDNDWNKDAFKEASENNCSIYSESCNWVGLLREYRKTYKLY